MTKQRELYPTMWFHLGIAVLLMSVTASAQQPDLVLHGTVKGEQNNTYIEVPFDVPANTARLTVSFHYTGKEERTTLDLGIQDPQRLRITTPSRTSMRCVSCNRTSTACC